MTRFRHYTCCDIVTFRAEKIYSYMGRIMVQGGMHITAVTKDFTTLIALKSMKVN